MKRKNLWLGLICLITSFSALSQEDITQEEETTQPQAVEEVQEVKYVTDKLRLSVYKQASDKSGSLKLLSSGDVLEVLGKKGPYSRVRTKDGIIGWVKNGFLLSTPTDSIQLVEEQKKNEILTQQLQQYADTQKLVDDYENTISKMDADFKNIEQQLNEKTESLEQLTEEKADLTQQLENMQQNSFQLSDIIILLKQYWYAAIIIVLLLFLTGFVTGRIIVEAQVKRRFQGVKVW